MKDNDKLSPVLNKVNDILKDHNGVYLEKKLYNTLKQEFPDLSRADFREVLEKLLQGNYTLERGLIRPIIEKKSKKLPKKFVKETKTGKGTSDTQRIPDKRL
jgi:hypothetical protein